MQTEFTDYWDFVPCSPKAWAVRYRQLAACKRDKQLQPEGRDFLPLDRVYSQSFGLGAPLSALRALIEDECEAY